MRKTARTLMRQWLQACESGSEPMDASRGQSRRDLRGVSCRRHSIGGQRFYLILDSCENRHQMGELGVLIPE